MPENNITNKREIAETTFNDFVRLIIGLLSSTDHGYSLIIAAGNSGLAMAEMTKLIYEYLDKQVPEIIRIPFDRKVLDSQEYVPYIVRPSSLTEPSVNVLFVDDEIGPGTTAATCFNIISKIIDPHKISKYTRVVSQ